MRIGAGETPQIFFAGGRMYDLMEDFQPGISTTDGDGLETRAERLV
jgi:hypothetical protein